MKTWRKFAAVTIVFAVVIAVAGPHRQKEVITDDYAYDMHITLPEQEIKAPLLNGIVETLFVSPVLDAEDLLYLAEGMKKWEAATNGIVQFKIAHLGDLIDIYPYKENGVLHKTTTVRIAEAKENIVQLIDSEMPDKAVIVGYYDLDNYENTTIRDMFFVKERVDSSEEYEKVIVHEIGHSIGMFHIGLYGKSVMYPGAYGCSSEITEVDLQQFCETYKCDPEVLNPNPAVCTNDLFTDKDPE